MLFCTVTALGLVRLVCQPKLMGVAVKNAPEASALLEALCQQPGVQLAKPEHDCWEVFHQLLRGAELPARLCSDAHLAALGLSMRTNIVIDDALMKQAMQASGARSKREAVELALRTLVKLQQQAEIRAFRGRLAWEGDLETQRLDHEVGELQA